MKMVGNNKNTQYTISRGPGSGYVSWGSYDGFNFAGWRSRCVPGMHRDPMHFRHRQTDGH